MLSETACPDNSGKSRLSAAKAGSAGKKIIIYLTIASMLNLVGCYYQQQMNPSEYNFDENLGLQVTTKDTIYSLSPDDYYYDKDTLFASVTKPLDEKTNLRYIIGIPIQKIEIIELEKTDIVGTSLIVLGVLVGVFTLVVAGAMSNGLY